MRTQGKFEISAEKRELINRIAIVLIIIAIGILTVDVFTSNTDGRRQIIDENGASEIALSDILSDIKGAGDVDVMIRYNDDNGICGVIVTSSGAGNVVVKNNLTNAVSAVFDIPISNVMVFEKEDGGIQNDK